MMSSFQGVPRSICYSQNMGTRLLMAIDCIYACANRNVITPFSFLSNVTAYMLSGSKLICNIFSKLFPSGSYTTIKTWLDCAAASPPQTPAGRDLITYFDNSQVLGRNWRVRLQAKMKVSVITCASHIAMRHGFSMMNGCVLHRGVFSGSRGDH